MDRVTLLAPAKINLVLRVDALGPDGYHPIRSLMAELPGITDTVTVSRAEVRSVDCPGVPERENLAWRAMDALAAHLGRPVDLAVNIKKRIPSQAGLGGGSSDAAATLRGARQLLAPDLTDDDLERIAAQVGSDVPFFVRGGVQWATGRGERLELGEAPPGWVVVARLPIGLSTARVYRQFDRMPLRRDPSGNDLWPAALALAPRLGGLARALRVAGAGDVLLCGSGSAMAAFVKDEGIAQEVQANALALLPNVWSAISSLTTGL